MLKHEEKEEEKVAEYPDQSHMISNLKQINNKLNEYLTNGIKENGHLDVDINREQYNTLQENDDVNHNSAQNTDLEHGEIINSGDKVTLQPVDINKKDGVKAVLETKKHTIVKFEKPDKENIERDKKLENQSLIDNKETLIDIKENENHSMKNERELKQNGKGDLTDDKGPNKQTATGNLDSENIEMMTLTSDNMIYKAQNHLHGQAIYSNPNLPTFLQNSLEEALSKIVIGEKSQEKTIEFIDYKDERHLPDLTSLITKDLSEPYSVYTYRYFLHNWPNLSFLVSDHKIVLFFVFVLFCFFRGGMVVVVCGKFVVNIFLEISCF